MPKTPSTTKNDGGKSPPQKPTQPAETPKEIGGRDGPDPVRYGDWEVGGKCVDF